MKAGFLDALRRAAETGELLVSNAPVESSLVQQLTASLERTQSVHPSTVPTASGVGQTARQRGTNNAGPRGALVGIKSWDYRKMTIDEIPGPSSDPVEQALAREVQPPLPLAPPAKSAKRQPNTTETGELACAFGEPWLGPHPKCASEVARICEVPVEAVPVPDLSAYAIRKEDPDATDEGAGSADGGAVPVGDGTGVPADPPAGVASPGLTYDLPTVVSHLPLFCMIKGQAGTGKTFWAKALADQNEGCVLAATTGIAAVNLGEGTTINSLLKYFNTQSLVEAFTGGWLEAMLVKHRRAGLQRILLDETSMLDGDQLTILCRAIDNVNAQRKMDEDPELGLILIGDFAQLPPVKAPFAFESAEWDRFAAATFGLTTIRRQADRDFIEALQAVRMGQASKALEFFGDRFSDVTLQHFEGPTLLAKNEAVEKYNQLRLDKVKGAPLTFTSTRWGTLRKEWGGPPKPPSEWGVPETLSLKVGARVMILANHNVAMAGEPAEFLYVNGDLATVLEHDRADPFDLRVRLDRTQGEVRVLRITRENHIPLEPGRRKQLRAEGHPERISRDGKHEVIGAVSYLPVRLAYGTTVHKSQGLSLDAVQVNIRDHFFSQPGMLYVALSRCRTAEGLRLVGNALGFRARCTVSQKVVPWL